MSEAPEPEGALASAGGMETTHLPENQPGLKCQIKWGVIGRKTPRSSKIPRRKANVRSILLTYLYFCKMVKIAQRLETQRAGIAADAAPVRRSRAVSLGR